MRVVVTGSTGFIGTRLCQRLSQAGLEVLGIGRSTENAQPSSEFCYLAIDWNNPSAILDEIGSDEPFVVVHLAWDILRRNHRTSQAEQVALLAKLLDHFEDHSGLQAIIAAGSSEEYGAREGPLSEQDAPLPRISAYGWAKRCACDLLRNWSLASSKPALWLRPFTVYGPGQRGNMLIPYAVNQALAGRTAEFTSGHQSRDFVYVDDVVDAFVKAVRKSQVGDLSGFESINLGSGEPVQVCQLLEWIANRTEATERFQIGALSPRSYEPSSQFADVTLAKRRLGWIATTTLEEGLQRVIQLASKEQRWAAQ